MNGYQISAEAYKEMLEQEILSDSQRNSIERKIKALEIMADLDDATRQDLFNSTGFNNICKGYLLMAMNNINIDSETKSSVMKEMNYLFDTVTADQAEQYYVDN